MDSTLLGHGSDWWNGAMLLSLGLAALVAFLVATATAGVIVVQKQEAIAAAERIARLEKDASSAKLETERLKTQLAWRTIDAGVAETLVKHLAAKPSWVCVAYLYGNDESLYLARQFEQIFQRAKWNTRLEARAYPSVIVSGFWIHGLVTGGDHETVEAAFNAAGLAFRTDPLPTPQMTYGVQGGCIVTVVVGAKMPPVAVP